MEDETKNTPVETPTNETPSAPVVAPMNEVSVPETPVASAQKSFAPKPKFSLIHIAIAIAVVVIVGAYLFTRGYIVAATVNGSPITRLSVIKTLEKENGKTTLEAAISKKLIDDAFAKQNVTATPEEIATEIRAIEANVASQGGTLDQALASQGMTRQMLEEQISTKVKLEKLLADKVQVSPIEVETYMAQNKITAPKGTDAETVKAQVADQLKQQKLQTEAQQWIAGLTAGASIKYYTKY